MNKSERRNHLRLKRLEPEVQRHQPVVRTRPSEFASLPPSQPNSLLLRDLQFSRIGDSLPVPK